MDFRIQASSPWRVWRHRSSEMALTMMLTSETPIEDTDRSAWTYGWVVSALVHILLAGGIFLSFAQERMVERRESFQWTVQLVGPPSSESPNQPLSPERAESNRTATRDRGAVDSRRVERPIERVVLRSRPVVEEPRGIERPIMPRVAVQRVVSEPTQLEVRETAQVTVMEKKWGTVLEKVSQVVPSAVERELPSAIQHPESSSNETLDEGDLPPAGLAIPADRAIRPHAVSAGIVDHDAGSGVASDGELIASGEHSPEGSAPAEELSATVSSEQPQPQSSADGMHRGMSPAAGSQGASAQPEYGWVARAIRARIEEVKRYSQDAKRNEWEGQVVLTASVQADGQIVDIQVRTSSGNAGLDENARAIVAEASPLHLPQPLGVARIRLRIPLQFGLE